MLLHSVGELIQSEQFNGPRFTRLLVTYQNVLLCVYITLPRHCSTVRTHGSELEMGAILGLHNAQPQCDISGYHDPDI